MATLELELFTSVVLKTLLLPTATSPKLRLVFSSFKSLLCRCQWSWSWPLINPITLDKKTAHINPLQPEPSRFTFRPLCRIFEYGGGFRSTCQTLPFDQGKDQQECLTAYSLSRKPLHRSQEDI